MSFRASKAAVPPRWAVVEDLRVSVRTPASVCVPVLAYVGVGSVVFVLVVVLLVCGGREVERRWTAGAGGAVAAGGGGGAGAAPGNGSRPGGGVVRAGVALFRCTGSATGGTGSARRSGTGTGTAGEARRGVAGRGFAGDWATWWGGGAVRRTGTAAPGPPSTDRRTGAWPGCGSGGASGCGTAGVRALAVRRATGSAGGADDGARVAGPGIVAPPDAEASGPSDRVFGCPCGGTGGVDGRTAARCTGVRACADRAGVGCEGARVASG
ncbi:hypothetical protein ACIOJD_09875 [Streptomyces sp. NPDC088116]|uniref:hypothetical protein n=1 Tax=Streptomyces sp. NPDC088116 TaxID=3365825 RepID=UPI0037F56C66